MRHGQVSEFLGRINAAKIVVMSEGDMARGVMLNEDDLRFLDEHTPIGTYKQDGGENDGVLYVMGCEASVGNIQSLEFTLHDEQTKLYDSKIREEREPV